MRSHELDARESSSRLEVIKRSATEGADISTNTTDGVPTTDGAGY